MGFDFDKALAYVVEREGSDLHIKVDAPPVARVQGDLWALKGADTLPPSDTEKALQAIAGPDHLAEFEENGRSTSPTTAASSDAGEIGQRFTK